MQDLDLISTWKQQNATIEQKISLHQQLLKENLLFRTNHALRGLKTIRWVGIIFGVLWCLALTFVLIASWQATNWFFKSAFIIHLGVSTAAIILYVYHLWLLHTIDNNQDILKAQKQLIELQNSNLKTLGLLWLQLPVFSMWFMSDEWRQSSPHTFWYIQVPIVLIQAMIGVWLYLNLNPKNSDKKWFKWFMSKGEFGKIDRAKSLLHEINELERNH